MKYDVFISYRRDDGAQYARILQLELEKRNYRVFLDYEEITDGIFGDEIKEAIRSAPIFIMVLTPLYLERSMEKDSWVREEINLAIEDNKHFIPIDPDKRFNGVPKNTPENIAYIVSNHQHSYIEFGQTLELTIDLSDILLEVDHLTKYFNTPKGLLHAVDGVSFTVERGKTLGIVGESGCGKSTTGRAILKLHEPTSGKILFGGEDITNYSRSKMRGKRTEMTIVFQDPFSSLDPRMSVSQLISEPIREHKLLKTNKEIEARTLELMDIVGLDRRYVNTYPHELDGGRRQRIGIARALAVDPDLIICDEPVSALDVSIQAQVLNLLNELQRKTGVTYIFVTHDLSVVKFISDDIAVMYLGQMVEKAPADELFANPLHPYTKALLSAIPEPIVTGEKKERKLIKGEITSPVNLPDQCRFLKRCDVCQACCETGKNPELKEVSPGHFVACHCVK